jgi:hypothetical protein
MSIIPLAIATFLADVFPNLKLHHSYSIWTRTDWDRFDPPLSEDEQDPEYIKMAKHWTDIVQMLEARRQELSQSLTNPNVRMESLVYN